MELFFNFIAIEDIKTWKVLFYFITKYSDKKLCLVSTLHDYIDIAVLPPVSCGRLP